MPILTSRPNFRKPIFDSIDKEILKWGCEEKNASQVKCHEDKNLSSKEKRKI